MWAQGQPRGSDCGSMHVGAVVRENYYGGIWDSGWTLVGVATSHCGGVGDGLRSGAFDFRALMMLGMIPEITLSAAQERSFINQPVGWEILATTNKLLTNPTSPGTYDSHEVPFRVIVRAAGNTHSGPKSCCGRCVLHIADGENGLGTQVQ